MEHDLVLEGKVVTPGGILETGMGISDGVIREFGRSLKGSRKIAAEGCYIFPGFIDIHVHLREPGQERKEDFRTGSAAAVHGGVTTMVDMPNNPIPADTPEALDLKTRLAKAKATVDVKFHGGIPRRQEDLTGISSRVAGYKLYLSETTGAVRFPVDKVPEVFKLVAATGRPLSLHCEDQDVIDRVRLRTGAETGPDAVADQRPPEAEVESIRTVLLTLKGEPELRANVCHASTRESVSLVRMAREKGLKASCEAALHHLYFTRRSLLENRLLRTNPPLRGEEDRAALIQGLKDGTVSFLVTDHAPHLEEEKRAEGLAGVPGLDDFAHLVSWLVKREGVDPATIGMVAAANPARHLNFSDRGELAPGMRADVTVVDLHSPEVVRNDGVRSKCGWSPYQGREFPGRARWVIRKGELLMDEFEQVS